MRIFSFCGTRYNTDPVAAGHLAAPPYDQIDAQLRDRLHRQDRHFSRLTRPTESQGNPHRHSADLHKAWMQRGVIQTDTEPGLYPYEIQLTDGRVRLGLCALVGLEGSDSRTIRRHEETVPKTVDERLSLLRTTGIDFEPILVLTDDGGRLNSELEADLRAATLIADHSDSANIRHKMYRLSSEERIDSYRSLLKRSSAVIADGHHRYTVAHRYAEEIKPVPSSPASMKLMVLTSLVSPGLSIDPVHRGTEQIVDLLKVANLVAERTKIEVSTGSEIARLVAAAEQPALGVGPIGESFEIWTFDRGAPPRTLGANLSHLSVGWLHQAIIPKLDLPPSADTDGSIVYRSDPDRLWAELDNGELQTGFWLPPMESVGFALATSKGEILPPKSTRFLLKLVSGLVWADHTCHIG